MDVSILFNPGLYQIKCLKNNKVYIGESSNILHRLGRHCADLENNRHDCRELQKDFNKYGKFSFTFSSLEQMTETSFSTYQYKEVIFRQKKETEVIQKIPEKLRYNKTRFNESFYAQGVKINNQNFPSLSNAATLLKESRTNLVRKCLDQKNSKYLFVTSNLTQKYVFRKSVSCEIEGVFYPSLAQAGKVLHLNHKTIKNRILSKKYPTYVFKVDRSNDYPEKE